MAPPLDVGIAPFLELTGGYTVRFTAVDATTGNVVSGVTLSGATVQYEAAPAQGQETVQAPVPLLVPIEV